MTINPNEPFVLSVVLVAGEPVEWRQQAVNLEAARAITQDILRKAKSGEPFELVEGFWILGDSVLGVRYTNVPKSRMVV